MTWMFDGSNRVVFSGKDGEKEFITARAAAGLAAIDLPPVPGQPGRKCFVAQGFAFRLEPQV